MIVKYSIWESKNFPIKREFWNNGKWILEKHTVSDASTYDIKPTKQLIKKAPLYMDAGFVNGEIYINFKDFRIYKKSDIKNIEDTMLSLWDFIDYLDKKEIIKLNPTFKDEFFS